MKITSVKAFLIESDLSGGEIKTKPRWPALDSQRRSRRTLPIAYLRGAAAAPGLSTVLGAMMIAAASLVLRGKG